MPLQKIEQWWGNSDLIAQIHELSYIKEKRITRNILVQ